MKRLILLLVMGAAFAASFPAYVLVHGAFADGSGWKRVADILQSHGYSVLIVQEPETNLPARLHQSIPKIGPHETMVLIHNDAVVQGLSEVPLMQDVRRWGILTIGTGLGNARFTNYWERSSD
jgi:hypothetical protein